MRLYVGSSLGCERRRATRERPETHSAKEGEMADGDWWFDLTNPSGRTRQQRHQDHRQARSVQDARGGRARTRAGGRAQRGVRQRPALERRRLIAPSLAATYAGYMGCGPSGVEVDADTGRHSIRTGSDPATGHTAPLPAPSPLPPRGSRSRGPAALVVPRSAGRRVVPRSRRD